MERSSVIGKRMKSGFAVKFRLLAASQEVKLLNRRAVGRIPEGQDGRMTALPVVCVSKSR
jgi:hypothetical protein